MAVWSAAYINDLPDSAFACIDEAGRHYPHHDASGKVDTAHLANARARVRQSGTASCGYTHLFEEHALPSDTKSAAAHAIRFVAPNVIEGLALPFKGSIGGRDIVGELLTAETDLCLDWFGETGRPVLYEHGLDSTIKTTPMGRQTEFDKQLDGVWIQAELDAHARYRREVDKLIEEGAMGFSGGAMPHLATKDRKSGRITRFPWVEVSLTPTPMEPATLGVHYLHSAREALEDFDAVGSDIPMSMRSLLAALDDRDEPLRDGGTLADRVDRLAVDAREVADLASEVAAVRAKSGRVLSAATRTRLASHPASLRELADELDQLLVEADAEKAADSKSIIALYAAIIEAEKAESRLLGVEL